MNKLFSAVLFATASLALQLTQLQSQETFAQLEIEAEVPVYFESDPSLDLISKWS